MIRPLHLGPHDRSQTRVGQCSRIDPVALGSWSNSAPKPYQSAIAVRQKEQRDPGLDGHSPLNPRPGPLNLDRCESYASDLMTG